MNTRKVLDLLKPKAKSLGFSRKELATVANAILESLPDDLEEEDEESEVNRKIEEYLPLLKVSQSAATRISATRTRSDHNDDEETDEETDEPTRTRSATRTRSDHNDDDFADAPRWAKRLAKMFEQGSESTIKRRAKVEALVDGLGKMGKHYLRDFDRHTFRSNEEWEDYFSDLKDEIHEILVERSDIGLERLSRPPMATEGIVRRSGGQRDLMSDEDVIKLAKGEI